jgi:C-terminal processing protease CtpA/Prc
MEDYIVISSVAPESPAKKSGLKEGDIIKQVEGMTITKLNKLKLTAAIQKKQIGDTLSIIVERKGKEKNFFVVLEREIDE